MRDGLSAILNGEPDLNVVGTASDGKAAVAEVDRLVPDIVIIDLSMPRTDGATAIADIKRKNPDVGVVVLTFHKDDAHIHAALLAGADAYVLKGDGRDDLLSAIHNVWAGKRYLSPAICDRVMSGYVRATVEPEQSTTASWENLSERERQVLKLVAEGYKTREIADYLSLSKKTVEKHRANMMRKLDLNGVSAVTTYAIENGLVSH
jgi:DNA-binding NarL/FixJ family response regulator